MTIWLASARRICAGFFATAVSGAASKVRYTPAIDTSSASRWVVKMRAEVSPRAPASARPLSGAYTWMLPSAITSAPGLTAASTTMSPPAAYTRWPERNGLSTKRVGAAAGTGAVSVGGAGSGAGAGPAALSTSSPACAAAAASSPEAFCTANGLSPRFFSSCASHAQSGGAASAGRRPHSNTAASPPKKSGVAANSVVRWVFSAACSVLLRMIWMPANRVVFSSSAGAGRGSRRRGMAGGAEWIHGKRFESKPRESSPSRHTGQPRLATTGSGQPGKLSPAECGRRLFPGDQQDGPGRKARGSLGDAAEEQAFQAAAAMSADDDEIGRPGFGIVGDGLGNTLTQRLDLDEAGFNRHPGSFCGRFGFVQDRLAPLGETLQQIGRFENLALHIEIGGIDHVHDPQNGLRRGGEADCGFQCAITRFARIHCHQDSIEHEVSLNDVPVGSAHLKYRRGESVWSGGGRAVVITMRSDAAPHRRRG